MSPLTRRTLLRTVAPAVAVPVAGCFGRSEPGTGSSEPGDASGPAATQSASSTTVQPTSTPTTAAQAGSTDEPVRCRGEPLAVERTVDDPPGYERPDDIEYFPENDTVRFVAARSGDEPAAFDTWTFEQWGGVESADVAIERVRDVLPERVGTDRIGSGITTPIGQDGGYEHVIVLTLATRTEDGEVVERPPVSLERLVAAAPSGVDVTLTLEGDEYARTVPVYAEHVTRQAGF